MVAFVEIFNAALSTWAPEILSVAIIFVNLNFVMNQRAKFLDFFSVPLQRLHILYTATIEHVRQLFSKAKRGEKQEAKDEPECPLLAELHAIAAQDEGSSRPILALLRDMKDAGLPTEPLGSAAVDILAARDDLQGVMAALMLSDVRTNSMVTETIRLLCRTNGEMAAVEMGKHILAEHGTYFLGPAVLDDLILAAGRLMLFDDVKAFFKHHRTVARPSVSAYALVIHALGCHGAVNDAVDLFEDLKAKQSEEENIAPAWNSLLCALTRNGRAERAVAVFKENRPELRSVPCVALGLCQLAPDTFADLGLWVPPRKRTLCPKHRRREREWYSEKAKNNCGW